MSRVFGEMDDDYKSPTTLHVRQPSQPEIGKQRGFKDEYILARGIPVFSNPSYGYGRNQADYTVISMAYTLLRTTVHTFKIPEELFYEEVPKFELVLRRKK